MASHLISFCWRVLFKVCENNRYRGFVERFGLLDGKPKLSKKSAAVQRSKAAKCYVGMEINCLCTTIGVVGLIERQFKKIC